VKEVTVVLQKVVHAMSGGAKEGALLVADDAGGADVFIEEGFELVMRRHLVALAAFLVQADPTALAAARRGLSARGIIGVGGSRVPEDRRPCADML
jgi:hypothetical protein